nr:MAG TPA: Spumavirus aspartic protease (A9) [Crassvirales sp.]
MPIEKISYYYIVDCGAEFSFIIYNIFPKQHVRLSDES